MIENGNDAQKKEAKEYLEKRQVLGDKGAKQILEENAKNNPTDEKLTK